jgi:hypothetical protein
MTFEGPLEEIASRHRAQVGQPPIAAKGDEMETSALRVMNGAPFDFAQGRLSSCQRPTFPCLKSETWGTQSFVDGQL